MVAESPSLPRHDRLRLNDDQRVLPPRPDLRDPRPEQTVRRPQANTDGVPLVHGELVTKGQDLHLEGGSGSEEGGEEERKGSENGKHRRTPGLRERGRALYHRVAAYPGSGRRRSCNLISRRRYEFSGRTRRTNYGFEKRQKEIKRKKKKEQKREERRARKQPAEGVAVDEAGAGDAAAAANGEGDEAAVVNGAREEGRE